MELQLHTKACFLRLIETALRYAEQHADKMAIVTTTADARRVIGSGRMAVFLGSELGLGPRRRPRRAGRLLPARSALDPVCHPDRLQRLLPIREIAPQQGGQKPDRYHGINERGRALIAEMNRLGILVDITHGTDEAQKQMIEASKVPVVCSHVSMKAVSGVGMSDEVLKAAGE